MDQEHATLEGSPAFFVYFNLIGRPQDNHEENKYGVFVNWDKSSWDSIKSKLDMYLRRFT